MFKIHKFSQIQLKSYNFVKPLPLLYSTIFLLRTLCQFIEKEKNNNNTLIEDMT